MNADLKAFEFDPRSSAFIGGHDSFSRPPRQRDLAGQKRMNKACTARGSGRFLKSTPIWQFVGFLLRAIQSKI
jgi:hypothetical protein